MAEIDTPTMGQPRLPLGSTAGTNLLAGAGPALGGPATSGYADAACTDACRRSTPPVRDQAWLRASQMVRALSWFSLAWMTAEGTLGLLAGVSAGSISLIGWALGSVIEGLASVIVVWRFTGRRTLSDTAEQRAQKGVAVSFFLLAIFEGRRAWRGEQCC